VQRSTQQKGDRHGNHQLQSETHQGNRHRVENGFDKAPICEKLEIVAQTKASVRGMLQTFQCQGGFFKFFFIVSFFFVV
jgi:hypothetical protein